MVANLHKISERENMPTRPFIKELTTSTASCVPTAPMSCAALERLRHNDGSRQTTEQALVFLEHRTLNRKFVARCEAAEVRPITVHDARHTCATCSST